MTTNQARTLPAPDHAFTPSEETRTWAQPNCATCGYPEGNRVHTVADVVVNGTTYGGATPTEVVDILERYRQSRDARLVLEYGDVETGQAWGGPAETGYIGRSMGPTRIPLSVSTSAAMGGSGILDHCIVRILTAKGKNVLWQHPTYQPPAD